MTIRPDDLAPGAGAPLVPGTPNSLIAPGTARAPGYLTSRKNLVGGGLAAAVGLVLLVTGLTGAFWPLAAVGVYVAAALLVPAARQARIGAASDPDEIRNALAAQARGLAGKASNEVYGKVAAVQASILALLPRVEHLPLGSQDHYIVRSIALEYLPSALEAYLSLPRDYASAHRVAGGETPIQVLMDQLNLLETKLGEISDDIAGSDSDRLLANGRFLQEKFGRSELERF